jgi:hypothetical protein
MSNEVTKPNQTGLGALGALKTGLANVRTKLPEVASSPYLRLLKDGDWVFGQEDNAVAKGTEAVINPLSIKHGYSCWTNRTTEEQKRWRVKNDPLGEAMAPLNGVLPAVHTLPLHRDPLKVAEFLKAAGLDDTASDAEREEALRDVPVLPWKDQLSMDVKFMTGKHKGTQVLYKVSSVGGLNACKGVLDAIMAKLDERTPFVCPIVTLDSDSYKHATYGKTYVPKIEVVGWTDLEGNEEEGDEDDGAPEPVTAKLAPPPEPEPVAEEPTRRRRRA